MSVAQLVYSNPQCRAARIAYANASRWRTLRGIGGDVFVTADHDVSTNRYARLRREFLSAMSQRARRALTIASSAVTAAVEYVTAPAIGRCMFCGQSGPVSARNPTGHACSDFTACLGREIKLLTVH